MNIFLNNLIASIRKTAQRLVSPSIGGEKLPPPARRGRIPGIPRGQVAIILIFIVAITLIFFAVVLNLSRVSQMKTLTMISANTTASYLASLMASYGESIFQVTLEGKETFSGYTGILAAIITVVIVVLAIVLAAASGGTSLVVAFQSASALIGLGAALAAVVLQVTVIDPGMTSMWNKKMSKTLTPEDQFVEYGIRTGLQSGVSDGKMVPDEYDWDMDRAYGLDGGNYKDKIGRFAYHYNLRLDRAKDLSISAIEDFQKALEDLVYKSGGTDWGMYDALDCEDPAFSGDSCCAVNLADRPAECNPCCVPSGMADESLCCKPGTGPNSPDPDKPKPCDLVVACSAKSIYGPQNPYIYNPYLDNSSNNAPEGLSFREQIGRDDEHVLFKKSAANPNDKIPQDPESSPWPFRMEDSTGFYPSDARDGIYPFLHKMGDWGINLQDAQNKNFRNTECHWTDSRWPGACSVASFPPGLSRLVLPVPPADPALFYNKTAFVDGENPSGSSGRPPLKVDSVSVPDGLMQEDNLCPGTTDHLWKKGADTFCSVEKKTLASGQGGGRVGETGWPYNSQCPKHGTWGKCKDDGENVDCSCQAGDSVPSLWADDTLDEMIYNMIGVIDFGVNLSKQSLDYLETNFESWYPQAAEWIEGGGGENYPRCYICDPEGGKLWGWLKELQAWKGKTDAWLDTNYQVKRWDDAWCYPPFAKTVGDPNPAGAPVYMSQGERTAIWNALPANNVNPDAANIDGVVACLEWNVNDPIPTGAPVGPAGASGNAAKFYACYQDCKPENCQNLPRSLVPNFDPTFGAESDEDAALFQACLDVGAPAVSNARTEACINGHRSFPGPCDNLPTGYNVPSFSRPQIGLYDSLNLCRNCYGKGGACSGVSCSDPLFEKSMIEAATCVAGGYGSCCEFKNARFYNWEAGNTYYDAIQNLLNGVTCANWGRGNAFYDQVVEAMGTCVYKTVAPAGSYIQSFNPVTNPAVLTATPADQQLMADCLSNCSFWQVWDSDDPTVLKYDRCDGCDSCRQLSGKYNIEKFQEGIFDPKNAQDQATLASLYSCLLQCSQTNCGNFPSPLTSSSGNSYTLGTFNSASLVDPNDLPAFQSCLNGGRLDMAGCALRCGNLPQATPNIPPVSYSLPPFSSPNLSVQSGYRNCESSCEGQTGNPPPSCGPSGLPQLTCSDPYLTKSKMDALICHYAGDCCDEWQSSPPPEDPRSRHYDWAEMGGSLSRFYNLVVAAKDKAANGSCHIPAWKNNIYQSYVEARNQVAKFEKRLQVLRPMVTEGKRLRNYLKGAIDKIGTFLEEGGPADALIQARIAFEEEEAISKQAIYLWQSDPPDGADKGSWHIVRVDVRIPRRCENACGVNGGPDPRWPYVKTSTSGVKRTYKLRGTDGMVKAKVTRYDEDRNRPLLRFPGGAPLWKFRFGNPASSQVPMFGDGSIPDMEAKCGKFMASAAPGAFMLDKRNDERVDSQTGNILISESESRACWDAANALLGKGVTSESCAQYYFRKGESKGFNLKFVPCKNFK